MNIYLGTDHAGFERKNTLKAFLTEKGFSVVDCGAKEFDRDDDYPDFCAKAANSVAQDPGSMGFVFGKSGTGEMIVANKVSGIRCGLGINDQNVTLAREHNDCNMLSFGSDFVDSEQMKALAMRFIQTAFSAEERHKRRIAKIAELDK